MAKLEDRNTIIFISLPQKSLTILLFHIVDKLLQSIGMEETKETIRVQLPTVYVYI